MLENVYDKLLAFSQSFTKKTPLVLHSPNKPYLYSEGIDYNPTGALGEIVQ